MNNIERNKMLLENINDNNLKATKVIDLLIESQLYCIKEIKDENTNSHNITANSLFSIPRISMVEQGDLENVLMDVYSLINTTRTPDFTKYSYLDWREGLKNNYKQEERYVIPSITLEKDLKLFNTQLPSIALKKLGKQQAMVMYSVLQYVLTGVGK